MAKSKEHAFNHFLFTTEKYTVLKILICKCTADIYTNADLQKKFITCVFHISSTTVRNAISKFHLMRRCIVHGIICYMVITFNVVFTSILNELYTEQSNHL